MKNSGWAGMASTIPFIPGRRRGKGTPFIPHRLRFRGYGPQKSWAPNSECQNPTTYGPILGVRLRGGRGRGGGCRQVSLLFLWRFKSQYVG